MMLDSPGFKSKWLKIVSVGSKETPFDETFLKSVRDSGAVEGMWSWLPRLSGGGSSLEAYSERVIKLTMERRLFPLMMFDKSGGQFVGGAAFLRHSRTHRSVEIGFVWLTEPCRNWKYFAATQEAMIKRASECGFQRISWQVTSDNLRMARALERLGAKHEGVLRSACRLNNGEWTDLILYAIVGDDIARTLSLIEHDLEAVF